MAVAETVTIMFTDLVASTELLVALGEDEFAVILDEHDNLVIGSVESHSGQIVKHTGDGVMAVFSGAAAAASSAVEIQEQVASRNAGAEVELGVRIGLSAGDVTARAIDYQGVAIVEAARLCAIAQSSQILASEAVRALAGSWGGHEFVSLGELELKGLPPLATLAVRWSLDAPVDCAAARPMRGNLPAGVDRFIGRTRDIEQIRDLLDDHRLVTLIGPGGSGKTRLALAVARDLAGEHRDGAWFVEFAALADEGLVAATVATELGVRDDFGRPVLDTVVEALRDRDILVVLDNCEHVIGAAAKIADALLRACPSVVLLATSREPLGITGEHPYRVAPLALPPKAETGIERIAASEAVQLFVSRVVQHDQSFALEPANASTVARVCRRLDGIPLAIELAAARLRSVGLEELDARLDHRFQVLRGGSRTALPRQQTLQALIDWSYDLLTEPERTMLSRLSVFAGGWDLDAAEAVTAASLEGWEVLDHLSALVDKSIVQAEATAVGTRYRLLETVREYAKAKLAGQGEAEVARARVAHRDYYLALAEAAAPNLIGHEQMRWLDRLAREHDNLRVALATSRQDSSPDDEVGLRIAVALRFYWTVRGHLLEGAGVLAGFLDASDARGFSDLRVSALTVAGDLLSDLGAEGASRTRYEEALTLARSRDDDLLAADAIRGLAWASLEHDPPAAALALIDDGLARARAVADRNLEAVLLGQRAFALHYLGDTEGARGEFAAALAIARAIGDHAVTSLTLNNLAEFELEAGDLEASRQRYNEAVVIARDLGSESSISHGLCGLAAIGILGARYVEANQLLAESLVLADRLREQSMVREVLFWLALVASRTGDAERAAQLHGAANPQSEELGLPFQSGFRSSLRQADYSELRAAVGDAEFEAAYAAGQALTISEATALALRA